MNITLRQISYFLAIAESGSVSGAATSLGISQSAITESLKALEDQTGAELFHRHSKGVSLTYQGHVFVRHARLIMASVADAGRALNERPEAVTGVLNLGVTSLVSGYMLADLLARFRKVFPNVVVRVFEEERAHIEHLLVNGELHIALMLISNLVNHQALGHEALARSPNRLWLAPDHPLLKRDSIHIGDLAGEPLIQLTIDEMAETSQRWWRQANLRPTLELKTSSVEAARSLVATGAGLAILPDLLYRPWSLEGDRLEVRGVEDLTTTIDIGIAWRKGSPPGEPARIFLELAREQRPGRNRYVV
ncbi:MAG TPA: LysR substrate-binding domain-containing protein [Candidatus Sulfotelmatobacter sp.]|nr:LysR substrate-binding domain-containing protein [Candidatus Sulfotelmatobacter sp.]